MSDTCVPYHDWFTATLTTVLCVGLVVSYLPQHYRIINNKSSEGLSPWFLLLGSTGCASGMLNMLALQWDKVKCCRELSTFACIEMTAGIFQLWLMWFLFTIILILYMIYYPPHLKYVVATSSLSTNDGSHRHISSNYVKSTNWKLSITLSWVTAIHLFVTTFVTFALLLTSDPQPVPAFNPLQAILISQEKMNPLIHRWATFLGVSSAILATLQYAPQLYHTYCTKLVGALSIPMMLIQTPGTVFMVLSIALRPGTNWTSWIMFAVSGIMQGSLLVMCIAWKFRQQSLAIDDFGKPLPSNAEPWSQTSPGSNIIADDVPVTERGGDVEDVGADEDTPLLRRYVPDDREGRVGAEGTTSRAKKHRIRPLGWLVRWRQRGER